MNFILRPLQESDLPSINQLFIATVHAVNTADYNQDQLDVWAPRDRTCERWQESFKDHIVYVAEKNGKVVGFGDIIKVGCLDHLFTHKDFQGQGIGGTILLKLEEVARSLGFARVTYRSKYYRKTIF